MSQPAPDPLKADIPTTAFGKILAATPVVMTVVATLLAGLASSEMTSAQYDRSLAAQQQSKAGDQWSYYQAKRLRSSIHKNALDIIHSTTEVHLFDLAGLKQAATQMLPENAGVRAELGALLDSSAAQEALAQLSKGEAPNVPASPALTPELQAAVEAITNNRSESETSPLIAQLTATRVDTALRAAQERALAFDAAVKPISQTIEAVDKLLSNHVSAGTGRSIVRDFSAARLRFEVARYDAEARLNQAIGNLHEVQVHLSNATAERHRIRSERFFFGMLMAQAAVIVSTLAMAARQKNALWSLAAAAGLVAIAFAIYVYLCV